MPRAEYDIAIVGAGPNGLTAAAYLARSGARVALLEKRFERGGTFASDDYSTPFLYNLAQFELPLGEELPPYRDLELGARGVSLIQPDHPFSVQAEPRFGYAPATGGRSVPARWSRRSTRGRRSSGLPPSSPRRSCARPPRAGPWTRQDRTRRTSGSRASRRAPRAATEAKRSSASSDLRAPTTWTSGSRRCCAVSCRAASRATSPLSRRTIRCRPRPVRTGR